MANFKCAYCLLLYPTKDKLLDHMIKHHGFVNPKEVTDFKCEDCNQYFSYKRSLTEHRIKHHGLVTRQKVTDFKCEDCNRYFLNERNLAGHITKYHNFVESEKVTYFKCKNCDKFFSNQRNLTDHMTKQHGFVKPQKVTEFKCDDCNKYYSNKNSLLAHLQKFHNFINKTPPIVGNFLCSMCSFRNCRNHKEFRKHLLDCHDVVVDMEVKYFNSDKDFDVWKFEVERTTNSFYRYLKKTKYLVYYDCNRSGVLRTKDSQERKRRLKINGSYKCGATCPARMQVKTLPDGTFKVCFYSRHIGHSLYPTFTRLFDSKLNQTVKRLPFAQRQVRSHHDQALKMSAEITNHGSHCLVGADSQHKVSPTGHRCNQLCVEELRCWDCHICPESYSCSCDYYQNRHRICRYIHYVHSTLNKDKGEEELELIDFVETQLEEFSDAGELLSVMDDFEEVSTDFGDVEEVHLNLDEVECLPTESMTRENHLALFNNEVEQFKSMIAMINDKPISLIEDLTRVMAKVNEKIKCSH